MKIHEYQAKELLAKFGVPVLRGQLALDADATAKAFTALGAKVAVVKAQVHAGGRGKAGGVKLVKSADEARKAAAGMFAKPLVTHQTGPEGAKVRKVWVEEGCEIARELYVGVVLDRAARLPVLMVSSEGGVEIEEVAARNPEKILREWFDPLQGLAGYQARRIALKVGLAGDAFKAAVPLLQALCRAFLEKDCAMVEVNPLVVTKQGGLIALDAKVAFDGNGLFRHKDVVAYRDKDEEDARESAASEHGLSWVSLDGNVGCMVNGAGLAMATMDAIKLAGGFPANFLDVGGGATKDQVCAAFKLILKDPKVKAVLVNIFGGIAKCDVIAGGILAAAKEVHLTVPLVVRLEGTNVELGRKMLDESGMKILTATTIDTAAKAVVKAAQGGKA
ncbi:MAG: ADP-forming succinate--CoA ligase subunit beta [Planctomycetes bacterium]|nr:ADP-forming succinate--CoA ligase subunit beta [Planctomycetota bacterium]